MLSLILILTPFVSIIVLPYAMSVPYVSTTHEFKKFPPCCKIDIIDDYLSITTDF